MANPVIDTEMEPTMKANLCLARSEKYATTMAKTNAVAHGGTENTTHHKSAWSTLTLPGMEKDLTLCLNRRIVEARDDQWCKESVSCAVSCQSGFVRG